MDPFNRAKTSQPKHLSDSDSFSDLENILAEEEMKAKEPAKNAEASKNEHKHQKYEQRAGTAPEKKGKTLLKGRSSLESAPEDGDYPVKEIRRSIISEDDRGSIIFMSADVTQDKIKVNADPLKDLEERIAKLDQEIKDEVEEDRKRLIKYNQDEIERKKLEFATSLELKKKMYEEQLKELENSKRYYEKLEMLADSINFNSNLINSVSLKLQDKKEDHEREKSHRLVELENTIKQREENIISQERDVESIKQSLQEEIKFFEKSEEEKRKMFDEEQAQIKKEREHLFEFYKMLMEQEKSKKQEIEVERIKLKALSEGFSKQQGKLSIELTSKLEDLKTREDILEKNHEETLKTIEKERKLLSEKKLKLEENRSQISSIESEYQRKLSSVEQREREIQEEINKVFKQKQMLEIEQSEFENEVYRIHQLSLELHNQSEVIASAKIELEREKQELAKIQMEVENLQSQAKNDFSASKELNREIQLQMKTYERMRCSLVQEMHSTTISQSFLDISNIQPIDVYFEPKRASRIEPKRSFNSSSYIKDLAAYDEERINTHEYINSQQSSLAASRKEFEGFRTELSFNEK
ncbi:unnamed protein product [Blepharisma stoltei]|uniref:Uncharacterized protein n=1 Tax=Blepharisma stoltei TaxID=1481888 RepID=A0AAU9J4H7_9CILI|nr:unnamed protein product [Blepharisma stoltei]